MFSKNDSKCTFLCTNYSILNDKMEQLYWIGSIHVGLKGGLAMRLSRAVVFMWVSSILIHGLILTHVDAGDIRFQFNYDASYIANVGSQFAQSVSDFDEVGNYISGLVKTNGGYDSVIRVDVSGETNSTSGYVAFAGGYVDANPKFNKNYVQLAVQDNVVNTIGYPEAVSTINFSWNFGYGSNIQSNQLDFKYVVLHELFHTLGFESFIDSNGTSVYSTDSPVAYSYFDQFVQGWDGSKYVNFVQRDSSNNPTGHMAGAANAVVDEAHPLLFAGPNVTAYLGHAAELYTPAEFALGSSISHYNYPALLEYFQIPAWGPLNPTFSPLDVAFLKDLGYTVVPEPGTYLLSLAGTVILVASRRVCLRGKRSH